MKILIGTFIFFLVLFIYIHVYFHLRTSEDLEIYELYDISKTKLEEVCDLRQPALFECKMESIIETSNKTYLNDNYHAFEVQVRNTNEKDNDKEMYLLLPIHSAIKLFNEDHKSSYFSENNMDFLQETGAIKTLQHGDAFLRPYMVSNCNYDIMFGSANTVTPFRFELNYRNYFMATEGSVKIKLAPPTNSKYLYVEYDYDNFEFRSPINPWKTQSKYIADFGKVKCLEITLNVGQFIYIPAYWWYSIKFQKKSSISCFKYRTYMNNIAISPHFAKYALQMQNIKHQTVQKHKVTKSEPLYDNKTDDTMKSNNDTNYKSIKKWKGLSQREYSDKIIQPILSNTEPTMTNSDTDTVIPQIKPNSVLDKSMKEYMENEQNLLLTSHNTISVDDAIDTLNLSVTDPTLSITPITE